MMKQILSIDVPTLRPRNPVALVARMRRAGPHATDRAARRQEARRELQRELDGVRTHRPPPLEP